MKKLLGLSMSAMVAFVMTPAHASTTDSFLKHTMVSANGYFAKPNNARLPFAVRDNAANAQGETLFIEPEHDLGYGATLEHILLPSAFNHRVNLVLEYQHDSTSKNSKAQNINTAIPGAAIVGAEANHTGSINYRANQWRLGLRQHHAYKDMNWRFGAFAEYVKLKRDYDLMSRAIGPNLHAQYFQQETVEGIGPSLDVQGQFFPWGRNNVVSLFAGGEAALLFVDHKYARTVTRNGVLQAGYEGRESQHSVTPHMGVTVGVNYARPISEDMSIGFSAGFKIGNYFNVFKHSGSLEAGRSDYSLSGPFLQVRVGGTHAAVI